MIKLYNNINNLFAVFFINKLLKKFENIKI